MMEEPTKKSVLELIEIIEKEEDPVEYQGSASNIHAMSSSPTDLEETKTDLAEDAKEELVPLDTAASSKHQSRSWLSEFPSQEETFTDGGKGGTLSYLSSFGDMSKATDSEPAPPKGMMNNLNSYFGAMAGAMQRTLYDGPVRELEKLRDMACASPAATTSDRQIGADPVAVPSVDKAATTAATKQQSQSKDVSNPFAVAFNELVDVLEIGSESKTAPKKTKFEEEKLEMMASASSTMGEGCASRGDLVF